MMDYHMSVNVDIDTPYDLINRGELEKRIQHIPRAHSYYIRKSSNGNTHVKVNFWEPVDTLKSFMIRAYLADDPYRIRGDLRRMYEHGTLAMYMVLFDEKYDGKLTKAGEWEGTPIL